MTASNAVVKRAFKLPEKQMSLASDASDTNKPLSQKTAIDPTFVPSSEEEMVQCLADPLWRICSGQIYKIMVKAPDEADNTVLPFIPNRAQRRLMARLWHRNIILKARQLGFTTLVSILWLDHALFNSDQRCVIVAQDKDTASEIFRDKVKLAYERLPAFLLERFPLKSDNATEIHFAHNNSSVKVSTSARGGTLSIQGGEC